MSNNNLDTAANHGPPPNISAGFHRAGSSDTSDRPNKPPLGMKPASAPYPRYSYPHHYPSRPPHPIQSVVTTSFSMEEEREDGGCRLPGPGFAPPGEYRSIMDDHRQDSREAPHYSRSPPRGREPSLYSRDLPPPNDIDRERRVSMPHDVVRARPMRIPPSPRGPGDDHPYLHRSHSAGGGPTNYHGQGPLKRSFWHHSRPSEEYQSSLPHDFMPPKRTKVTPMRKEFVVTARSHPDDLLPVERNNSSSASRPPSGWFNRTMSWEPRDEYYHRSPTGKSYAGPWVRHSSSYREGDFGPHWSDAPPMTSPRSRYSPSESASPYERPPWSHSRGWHPYPEDVWGVGPQNRDEAESKHSWGDSRDREGTDEMRRQGTFESCSETDSYRQPPVRLVGGPLPPHGIEMGSTPKAHRRVYPQPMDHKTTADESAQMEKSHGPIRLLSLPEDRISLSETLCVVREVSN